MRIRNIIFILVLVVSLFVFSASAAFAQSFSTQGGATTGPPDDIFNPPPVGPPPLVSIPGAGGGIEVNAISYGHVGIGLNDIMGFEFSVDPSSVGAVGTAVATEAAAGEAEADIFKTAGPGVNIQLFDGDSAPPAPAGLGLNETSAPFDNLDGYDRNLAPTLSSPAGGGPLVWFSVDIPTATGAYGGGSATDIYVMPAAPGYSAPTPTLYAPSAALAPIFTTGDDIDALVVLESGDMVFGAGDCILFSLAPGSPAFGIIGGNPATIFATGACVGGFPITLTPESSLGLLTTDNVDALALSFTPTAINLQDFSSQPDNVNALLLMSGVLVLALVSMLIIRRRKVVV